MFKFLEYLNRLCQSRTRYYASPLRPTFAERLLKPCPQQPEPNQSTNPRPGRQPTTCLELPPADSGEEYCPIDRCKCRRGSSELFEPLYRLLTFCSFITMHLQCSSVVHIGSEVSWLTQTQHPPNRVSTSGFYSLPPWKHQKTLIQPEQL